MVDLLQYKRRLSLLGMALLLALSAIATPWMGMVGSVDAAAPVVPVNVRLLTGGNSVAVLWEPASAGSTATLYKVYRGGVLKATLAPSNTNLTTGNTQRWLDTSVVNGTAYSYQVSAVNGDGESALTTAKSITHSSSPGVPTVNIDAATPASLLPFANNVKATLQAWYPKFVWFLGNPAGTSTTINLKPIPGLAAVAQQNGNTIEYRQEWAVANANAPTAPNLFLHEATHLLQLHGTGTTLLSWAHEGMADYMQRYVYGDSNLQTITPTTTDGTWLRGYEYVAYFLNYVSKTYNKPNLVRDFDASFAPGYNTGFFKAQTGLTVGELWEQMGGRRVSSPTFFKNVAAAFKCLELTGTYYNAPNGSAPKLANCNAGSMIQQWAWIPDTTTSQQGELRIGTIGSKCLDVYGSGTTDGTPVYVWDCNTSGAQKWILMSDGSLQNPQSGKCLQPIAGATTIGTAMEIATCSGADIQDWFQRPPGMLKIQYGSACISAASPNPSDPVKVYNCSNGLPGQNFRYLQTSPGSVWGAIKNRGNSNCLQPVGGSLLANATLEFVACTGSTAQQWQWQSDNTIKNNNSGLCITLPAWASPWQLTQTTCASPTSLKKFDALYQY